MISWHYVTLAAYNAASEAEKTADKLFFIQETGEIYRGMQKFSQACELYTDEPTNKAVGRIYINATTLEGKIWNGAAWQTVIQPVQSTLVADNTNLPVSGKAVADHVATEINKVTNGSQLVKGVAYVPESNSLTVTMADGTSDSVAMSNVAADLVYDKASGLLQVKNAAGTTIGTGINLDLERFVEEATYDHETGEITLRFNQGGEPLVIDIGALVDTYTAADTSTVHLAVTGNQFTAEVLVAATEGNLLQKTDSGLYVAPVDQSMKMDKDTDAVAGNLAIYTEGGNVVDAGAKIGGETLAATPLATTLATEKAVDAVRTALTNLINTKMNKLEAGNANEVLISTADGHAARSAFTLGGENMGTGANVLATEAGVNAFVQGYAVAKTDIRVDGAMKTTTAEASDSIVPSEKAVVGAMSWKTSI